MPPLDPLETVTLAQLAAYLRAAGWTDTGRNNGHAGVWSATLWTRGAETAWVHAAPPPSRVALVAHLAYCEGRAPADVRRDLLATVAP